MCADRGIPLEGTKGASVHMRSLAAALVGAGHEVVGFAAARPASGPPYPAPVHVLESARTIADVASSLGTPDVVYERYSLGHAGGLLAARWLGRPFVLEVNAPLVLEAGHHRPGSVGPGDADVERWLYRGADLVVAVSEPLRRHVAEVRGTDEGTTVVPNARDPALYPSPAALDGAAGATLVFLGHPKPWHGAQHLPHLVALLRGRGVDVRLLVVGGGKGADAVVAAAGAGAVAPWVEVTGPLAPGAAAARLVEGTVAVAPYPPDSFFYFCPLKVVECMAAGLPVVTTAQGDLPIIVGDAGVLVPPGDVEAMARAVEDLVVDEGHRRRLGGAARARALACFTWEAAADRLVQAVAGLSAGAVA